MALRHRIAPVLPLSELDFTAYDRICRELGSAVRYHRDKNARFLAQKTGVIIPKMNNCVESITLSSAVRPPGKTGP